MIKINISNGTVKLLDIHQVHLYTIDQIFTNARIMITSHYNVNIIITQWE